MEDQKIKPVPLPDGVYLNLDEDEYHDIPRQSGSGIQNVIVSPATFWEKSWLNPKKKKMTDEQKSARFIGRAYHAARLEPEKFERCYVRDICIDDFEKNGLVRTGTDIKEALGELGQTKSKPGELVADAAQRLHYAGYTGVIWPLEVMRFNARLDMLTPRPMTIAPDTYDQMLVDIARIHDNPEIHDLLSDGIAEVSILYTDEHGIPMKSRLDYLRTDGWADFKTFANPAGKVLNKALNDALQYNRYYIQAAIYRDAYMAARALPVFGASDYEAEVITKMKLNPADPKCHFIFQEKGGTPNIIGREFVFHYVDLNVKMQHAGASDEAIAKVEAATREPTLLYARALFDINRAKREYLTYCDVYAPCDPWYPLRSVEPFRDEEFNKYWLSGEYS